MIQPHSCPSKTAAFIVFLLIISTYFTTAGGLPWSLIERLAEEERAMEFLRHAVSSAGGDASQVKDPLSHVTTYESPRTNTWDLLHSIASYERALVDGVRLLDHPSSGTHQNVISTSPNLSPLSSPSPSAQGGGRNTADAATSLLAQQVPYLFSGILIGDPGVFGRAFWFFFGAFAAVCATVIWLARARKDSSANLTSAGRTASMSEATADTIARQNSATGVTAPTVSTAASAMGSSGGIRNVAPKDSTGPSSKMGATAEASNYKEAASAEQEAKTPVKQRLATVETTTPSAASGAHTPGPAPALSTSTPSASCRRSPLSTQSPNSSLRGAMATLCTFFSDCLDLPAQRAALSNAATALRLDRHRGGRPQRQGRLEEEGGPLASTPLQRLKLDDAETQDESEAGDQELQQHPSSVIRAGTMTSSVVSGQRVPSQQLAGASSFANLHARLPTLPEDTEVSSGHWQDYGAAAVPRLAVGVRHQQQQMFQVATDEATSSTSSAFPVSLQLAASMNMNMAAMATALASFSEPLKENNALLRQGARHRNVKEQQTAMAAAMQYGLILMLAALTYCSFMWGRVREVTRRCAVDPGLSAPAAAAASTAAAAAAGMGGLRWSGLAWWIHHIVMRQAMRFPGWLLDWPWLRTGCCYMHELGLYSVGIALLLYPVVWLLRSGVTSSMRHTWLFDIPLKLMLVWGCLGSVLVFSLGGMWTVWGVAWLLWCAAGMVLHVKPLSGAWAQYAAAWGMALAAGGVGVLPYVGVLRPAHFVLEEQWFAFVHWSARTWNEGRVEEVSFEGLFG